MSGSASDGLVVLVALAMAVGAVGTVVPFVPGLGLVWLAAVVYGVAAGVDGVGAGALIAITALALAGTAAGVLVPRRVAGRAGAAPVSLWLGAGLAVVGFFVVPVVGLPLGGVVGVYLGERARTRDPAAAWRATRATLVGVGVASLVQLAVAVAMILVWVAWVLLD